MEFSLKRTAQLLRDSSNIVLTAHIHPDGDCLGSMLALNEYLLSIGKNVQMMIDDDVPEIYKFLPGSQTITKPNSHQVSADVLVVLDASDVDRIGKVKLVVDAPILNIDHHLSNTKFADYWYVDSKSAATGEIVLQLLQLIRTPISVSMAMCLYTAIATDCGFFRYANTSAATFRYAAYLIECGVEPHVISENLDSKPLSSILTLTKVLETLEVYHNGRIATITITDEILDADESTEGFINYPRNIEGVEIAIMFKIASDNNVRISFRSKQADVSQIALSFGGGGHLRASGCTVSGNIEHVKESVIDVAIKQLAGMK
jgi:phosphoesterase RecJ-like protein